MLPKNLAIENRFSSCTTKRCFRNTENLKFMFKTLWNFLFVLDQDRNAESPQCLLKHGSVFMLRMEKKNTTGKQ